MGEPPDHHASQSVSEGKKGELVGASWTAMRATSRFAKAAGEAPSQLVACQRSPVVSRTEPPPCSSTGSEQPMGSLVQTEHSVRAQYPRLRLM